MYIEKSHGQVVITFENEKDIEFLIGMCYACLDYDLDGENRENSRVILDIVAPV